MIAIRQTETFSAWLQALRDSTAKAKIAARVQRLAFGNPGDVRPVGGGVSELRIHHGPGYRVYYMQRGTVLIVLLCGGDKATQDKDIETAKRLAKDAE
ncbi:MAG: type II toxin-antitoxin system RelE/ParE family toxin [Acidobacteriaceae bacterium]